MIKDFKFRLLNFLNWKVDKIMLVYAIKGDNVYEEFTVKENTNFNKNKNTMNTFQICGNIEKDGLIIDIQVFKTSDDFLKYYNEKNYDVKYITIKGLIDTGADRTAISDEFIKKLELEFIGKTKAVGFGSTINEVNKHKCLLYHPIFKNKAISIDVINNDFSEQPYNAVLGRDFLVDFTLIYDGWSNTYRLINVCV